MRELKFRCWCPYNKEMYTEENSPEYSFEVANGGISMIPPNGFELYTFETNIQDDGRNSFLNIIPMQFTGLKDKNGIDIYEGDILTFDSVEWNKGAFSTKSQWEYPKWVVEWDYKNACWDTGGGLNNECETYKSIIGNIYEHPHPLKKR